MSIRMDALPELDDAWNAAARDLAANARIQISVADFGGLRTQADTTTILNFRDQDYAVYAAQMQRAGQTPQSKATWRPIVPFGTSFHNYGAARDARIVSKPAGMTTDQATELVRIAMNRAGLVGLTSENDPLHFQLPAPLATVQQWWTDYQNQTGRYAPADDASGGDVGGGGDISTADYADDAGGDDDGGGATPGPAGKAVMSAALTLLGALGAYVLYRRFAA